MKKTAKTKLNGRALALINRATLLCVYTLSLVLASCGGKALTNLGPFGELGEEGAKFSIDLELRRTLVAGVHFERYFLVDDYLEMRCGMESSRSPSGALVRLKEPSILQAEGSRLPSKCINELHSVATRLQGANRKSFVKPRLSTKLGSNGQVRLRVYSASEDGSIYRVIIDSDLLSLDSPKNRKRRDLKLVLELLRSGIDSPCGWPSFGDFELKTHRSCG